MAEEKSMAIAMIISFFLSGLGLAYAGDIQKGVIIFVASIAFNVLYLFVSSLFGIAAFVVWIYGMYATYERVNEVNGA